jgi:hypothetical protein
VFDSNEFNYWLMGEERYQHKKILERTETRWFVKSTKQKKKQSKPYR